jgi:hypothetical protein
MVTARFAQAVLHWQPDGLPLLLQKPIDQVRLKGIAYVQAGATEKPCREIAANRRIAPLVLF